MMLIAALGVLTLTVLAGMGLGVLHILMEKPPGRLTFKGAAHGLGGIAGVGLLLLALSHPTTLPAARAAKRGAGAFGNVAGVLLAMALLGGLVILIVNLRRKPIPGALIAAHSVIAVVGYVLLATYFTML